MVLVLVLVLVVIRMPMFFTRFDLVLVAVENRAYEDGQIHINPPHRRVATNNIRCQQCGVVYGSSLVYPPGLEKALQDNLAQAQKNMNNELNNCYAFNNRKRYSYSFVPI